MEWISDWDEFAMKYHHEKERTRGTVMSRRLYIRIFGLKIDYLSGKKYTGKRHTRTISIDW